MNGWSLGSHVSPQLASLSQWMNVLRTWKATGDAPGHFQRKCMSWFTHTIWTHLKSPCMICLSGLSLSLDKNGEENWANWTVTDTTTFWASSDPVQNRGSIFQPTFLPRQRFFLDSGRDEDSRIDADQCTGRKTEVKTSLPGLAQTPIRWNKWGYLTIPIFK